jgi:hypothetical protein
VIVKSLIAGVLGVSAALLVACGSTKGLVPTGNAGTLQSDLDAIASNVASGNCTAASQAVSKAQQDLASLPSSVNVQLRQNLTQGFDKLASSAATQCQQQTTTTQTTTTTPTTTTTTPTTTTQTTTTPTTTTTTPTTTTTTPTTTTPTTSTSPGASGGTPASP